MEKLPQIAPICASLQAADWLRSTRAKMLSPQETIARSGEPGDAWLVVVQAPNGRTAPTKPKA